MPYSEKNQDYINIAAEMPRSVANGPGMRYVVWVQGCSLHCPGCFNPDFQALRLNRLVPVEELAKRVLATPGIEGVTYTGGEPFLQDEPLYLLSTILKGHGLGIVCYTGFTLEELRDTGRPCSHKLVGLVDMLIDGRFELAQRANLLWRGSANQRVHFLTDRYAQYRRLVEDRVSEMEISVSRDNMLLTGNLQSRLIHRLEQVMAEVPQ